MSDNWLHRYNKLAKLTLAVQMMKNQTNITFLFIQTEEEVLCSSVSVLKLLPLCVCMRVHTHGGGGRGG